MTKLEGKVGGDNGYEFAIGSIGASLLGLIGVLWGSGLPCDASLIVGLSIIVFLLACEIAAIVLGVMGRYRSQPMTIERRLGTTGLLLGMVLLPLMPIAFVLLGIGHCGFGMATGL